MRFACWINRPTDTHSEYVANTYSFSTATVVTRTRLNGKFIRTVRFLLLTRLESKLLLFSTAEAKKCDTFYTDMKRGIWQYFFFWSIARGWKGDVTNYLICRPEHF